MKIKIVRVKENITARACSFFLARTIELGYRFYKLDRRTRNAILFHEMGHVKMCHTGQRILCAIFAFPLFWWLCWWQELQADAYAAKKGYCKEMLALLSGDCDGGFFHPSNETRRKHLKKYEHIRPAPVKS